MSWGIRLGEEDAGAFYVTAQDVIEATGLPKHWFTTPEYRARKQVPHLALVGSVRFSLQALWEWEQNHSTVGRPPEPKAPRQPDTEPVDLYSRRIVGWSMQESMTSQLVVDALMMAVWRRGKPVALLHRSDQGSQYTSEHFQKLLDDQGITCSMSRAGEVWDNSAMESFFSSLKTERTARKVYRTRGQARSDVFDYIECFYNPTRRHSTLGYLSPVQFEQAQKA